MHANTPMSPKHACESLSKFTIKDKILKCIYRWRWAANEENRPMWILNGFFPNTKRGVSLNQLPTWWLYHRFCSVDTPMYIIVIAWVRKIVAARPFYGSLKGDPFSKRRGFSQPWITWFVANFGLRFHKRRVPWSFLSKFKSRRLPTELVNS